MCVLTEIVVARPRRTKREQPSSQLPDVQQHPGLVVRLEITMVWLQQERGQFYLRLGDLRVVKREERKVLPRSGHPSAGNTSRDQTSCRAISKGWREEP